ncbi:NAD(P)/FAD-dependent oxidoreductase [Microbacterium sp.]|uniref:NAD(P)/FAD-dependent oxidoreductase n=1 Tax=Microbacterium sp. TaxID=51671 RepID=UPI00273698FE|nr:NAD(P)/FAD-dependent oxidoreductase [Microbacterium sp.]MDP3951928.1 NAD(P)/FAD-dependent oxidoreductase [Microbacterium sp.]
MSTKDIQRIVVVGAGLAGASAAEELRKLGYDAALTVIGAEQHPPYERPPLSKGVLTGAATPGSALVHPAEWYTEQGIDLLTGTTVARLGLERRQVALADRVLPFDQLLITTGARPRRFDLADAASAAGANVVYLRTLGDAELLRDQLGKRLLIVGGGWIGLEVAAAARTAGGPVTVVEAAELPLVGVLGPEIATVFADLHRSHDVNLKTGTTVAAITHEGGRTKVSLSDGTQTEVDLIVVGIGAEPNTDLAQVAGLEIDNGILVDAQLRTSTPGVYAAGDVANHDHPDLGRIRVEHWEGPDPGSWTR